MTELTDRLAGAAIATIGRPKLDRGRQVAHRAQAGPKARPASYGGNNTAATDA